MNFYSIIMPLYNKERYVKNTIQSILTQTNSNFELIIVDDGSTDNSPAIIKEFSDQRIHYIRQNNGGASSARNRGIALAKSEWIAFIDGDDLWLPDFLETIDNLRHSNPTIKVFGGGYIYEPIHQNSILELTSKNRGSGEIEINNYFDYALRHDNALTASTTVLQKEIIAKVGGFPEGISNWEDVDLWVRIGLRYDIVLSKKITAIYNNVPTSANKVPAKLCAPVFKQYRRYCRDKSISKSRRKTFKEYVIRQKMVSAYRTFVSNGKGLTAFFELLPYFYTKRNRRDYLSMMMQFIVGRERFLNWRSRKNSKKS